MPTSSSRYSDDDALKRLQKDCIALMFYEPFFAYLLTRMKKKVDASIPVAAVSVKDSDITLYINPQGYLEFSLEERLFILIHEIMHVIFYHPTRKQKRKHDLWNIACDVAINQLINARYTKMPQGLLKVDSWKETKGFVLPPLLTAEKYYAILDEKFDSLELPPDFSNSPFGSRPTNPEGDSHNKSNDASSNSNLSGNTTNDTSTEEKNQNSSMHPNSINGEELHPTWSPSDDDTPEEVNNRVIQGKIKEAFLASEGKLPAALKTHISDVIDSKVNWVKILRTFIANQRSTLKNSTWKRANRRLGDSVMGYKKMRKLCLVIGIDTSASISVEMLMALYSEIVKIKKSGAEVIVIECDAKVQDVYKFDKHRTPVFKGRGGTDFRPLFEAVQLGMISLLRKKPDGIIFFTDGKGTAPDNFPIPTLWCLTKNNSTPHKASGDSIQWGKFLTIDV